VDLRRKTWTGKGLISSRAISRAETGPRLAPNADLVERQGLAIPQGPIREVGPINKDYDYITTPIVYCSLAPSTRRLDHMGTKEEKPKTSQSRKQKIIAIGVYPVDLEQWKAAAKAEDRSLSYWIRRKLNEAVAVPAKA
jgi:hypothetical protein